MQSIRLFFLISVTVVMAFYFPSAACSDRTHPVETFSLLVLASCWCALDDIRTEKENLRNILTCYYTPLKIGCSTISLRKKIYWIWSHQNLMSTFFDRQYHLQTIEKLVKKLTLILTADRTIPWTSTNPKAKSKPWYYDGCRKAIKDRQKRPTANLIIVQTIIIN